MEKAKRKPSGRFSSVTDTAWLGDIKTPGETKLFMSLLLEISVPVAPRNKKYLGVVSVETMNGNLIRWKSSWTPHWDKITVPEGVHLYVEAHGYFGNQYLNLSVYILTSSGEIKNMHINTNSGKINVNQGDVVIYKESSTVLYIYYTYNTNAIWNIYNYSNIATSALTIAYNVPAPSVESLTKIVQLADYNGQDDF